jgi:protease-4
MLRISIAGLLVISACVGVSSGQAASDPPVVAHFHLSGMLSESPVADPFGLTAGELTSLKDLVRRMDKASADDKLKAVILTCDGMQLGLGQLQEVRQAIDHLKTAGKRVYVHAEDVDTRTYALLCVGNRLSLAPQSSLWLTGIYGQSLYVKGLLDKIGVRADYLHMGDYKSAAEMMTRTSPSAQAEENLNWIFDGIYGSLVEMIAKSRGKKPEEIRDLVDHGPYIADQALQKGLIDAVETQQEFLAQVRKEVGEEMTVDNHYGRKERAAINFANPLAAFSLLAEMFKSPATSQKDTVAVIYIDGAILPGYSQPSLFGAFNAAFSGDIQKALEKAAESDSVKAVVMRVDSPGGSAQASEAILNAAGRVRAKKPLIVSMGDVAGSGGYYVSCGADAIFADEATITASIGVVGGKLVTTDLWGKLGVNWVGYKRGANSDMLNSDKPFSDSQRQLLHDYMQQVYEAFKGHVTKGRGDKLRKPIDEIAGGRVYTGKQALDLGLVDQIGGLQQAIEYAAAKASIKDYEIRVLPEPKDFFTLLIDQYSGEGENPTDITVSARTSLFASDPTLAPLLDLLRRTEPQRAQALTQALQRIELLCRENVILMMPIDIILQ